MQVLQIDRYCTIFYNFCLKVWNFFTEIKGQQIRQEQGFLGLCYTLNNIVRR